jgi:hypothetical protein
MDYTEYDNHSWNVPHTSAVHTWIDSGTLASQHADSRIRRCTDPPVISV